MEWRLDNSVDITMSYGLDGRNPIPDGGKGTFFSNLQRPDRLWGPSSLLSSGYRNLLLQGKAASA
jgi:hypothetical protein